MKQQRISLFLDSGAHSLYTSYATVKTVDGKRIERVAELKLIGQDMYSFTKTKEFRDYFEGYIKFVCENKQYLDVYVNLDIIGNAELTWENQKIMESHGLQPLPVFHLGEDFKWLKKYADKYDYIGIGGLGQEGSKTEFVRMADRIFCYICPKPKRTPIVKTHGFAMTSLDLMFRYPWYSVDSTSWVLTSRFGAVFVPRFKNGKYVYSENPWKVAISTKAPTRKEEGKHFFSFSPAEQEVILNYFRSKGFSVGKSEIREVEEGYKLKTGERWFGKEEADSQREVFGDKSGFVPRGFSKDNLVEVVVERGLCNDYRLRDQLNVIYFGETEVEVGPYPPTLNVIYSEIEGLGLR